MNKSFARLLFICLLLPITACDKKQAPPEKAPVASPPPVPVVSTKLTPARQTTFDEVTRQLDPGGDLYVYFSTDQWLTGLSTNVAYFRDLVMNLSEIDGEDKEVAKGIFALVESAVKDSGVESLTGVGISSVQITPDLHRTKVILHHREGQGDGLLWNVLGQQPHALTGLDLLTTNTAFATFGDLNLKMVWESIRDRIGKSGLPNTEMVQKWPELFEQQTQLSWDKLLASFGGEVGIVLTLDADHMMNLPIGEKTQSIPEPGLLVVVKVNDDLIFNRVSAELKQNPSVELSEENGCKLCVMPVPLPLPMDLRITLASTEGYLMIASSPKLVREALAVRAGNRPGLRKSAEFAALAKHLPAEGNQFVYVDRRISETMAQFQKQALDSEDMGTGERELLEKLLEWRGVSFGLSIGSHTATGWQSTSVGNQNASAAFLVAPAIPAVAVISAMTLPALAKAKERAQRINCVNNMKQQGLAFRIWAQDHEDKFPFNVEREKGGTLEACNRGADGYDRGSYRHFMVMSNELHTPKILVCPADTNTKAAQDFPGLLAGNVSYSIRSGEKVDEANPTEVLIYCPIHQHVCYADGSVKQGARKE